MRDSRVSERLIALFLLGLMLFSSLMLRVFDVGAENRVFGIPALFLYLFTAWAVLIGLMALVVTRPAVDDPESPAEATPPPAAGE